MIFKHKETKINKLNKTVKYIFRTDHVNSFVSLGKLYQLINRCPGFVYNKLKRYSKMVRPRHANGRLQNCKAGCRMEPTGEKDAWRPVNTLTGEIRDSTQTQISKD
jgi:hypothetical protein